MVAVFIDQRHIDLQTKKKKYDDVYSIIILLQYIIGVWENCYFTRHTLVGEKSNTLYNRFYAVVNITREYLLYIIELFKLRVGTYF